MTTSNKGIAGPGVTFVIDVRQFDSGGNVPTVLRA